VTGGADVIVDFSHHAATKTLTDYAVSKKIPLLVATTGQTDAELDMIRAAAKTVPVFFAANYSLGIAALIRAAKAIAALYPDADIEIIEKHHNRKLDAPSGTALSIARALSSVREGETAFTFGRGGQMKRQKNEIGIHAVRLGNIVGEHEVLIGTDNETITLKHEAHSRALFAEGALAAASFLIGKPAGLYGMNDLVANRKNGK
jgi:4-hydroxy-tetrahydrodipicolinate reductase